jgi:hypothetical protein
MCANHARFARSAELYYTCSTPFRINERTTIGPASSPSKVAKKCATFYAGL